MAIYPIILAFILSSTFNAVEGLKCQQGGDRPFQMFIDVVCPHQEDKCAEMVFDVFEERPGRNSTEQFGNGNATTTLYTIVVKGCMRTCDEFIKASGKDRPHAKDEPQVKLISCNLCEGDLCNGGNGGLKCQQGFDRHFTNVECAQQQDQCAGMTLEFAEERTGRNSTEKFGNANGTSSDTRVVKGCAQTCEGFVKAINTSGPRGKGFGKDAKATSCSLCKGDFCNGGGNGATKLADSAFPLT